MNNTVDRWAIPLALFVTATTSALPPGWNWDIGPAIAGPVGPVYDMVVWDDGTGEALYAVGDFDYCGGLLVSNIAKWDGEQWSSLGWGMWDGRKVRALAVFNNELIAAGEFIFAGDKLVANIARWDGQEWHPLGQEGDGLAPQVHDLVVAQESGEERLYASGRLSFANSTPITQIASWDGQSWRDEGGALPPEVLGDLSCNGIVRLIARNTPTGLEFAALNGNGHFGNNAENTGKILVGTPDAWTLAPSFPDGGWNYDLAFFGEPGFESLYVCGDWHAFFVDQRVSVVRLNGSAWEPVLQFSGTISRVFSAMAVAEHADGRWLYAAGRPGPGGSYSRAVHRFDGQSWEIIESTTNVQVNKLVCWDHGENWGVFAGVDQLSNGFTNPAITINNESGFGVARWGRADCAADLTTAGESEGDDFYGIPDGIITAADINYFVNFWGLGDASVSDMTTQGAGPTDSDYGVPDGFVSGADINYYVNLWVAGCP